MIKIEAQSTWALIPIRVPQAVWTAENAHLQSNLIDLCKSPHLSLWTKISTVFNRAMEYIARWLCPGFLHNMAKEGVVPSAQRDDKQATKESWLHRWDLGLKDATSSQKRLQEHYTPHQLNMTTPDGVAVEGIFYKDRRSESNDIPTIVCFNPNGAFAYDNVWDWLLKKGYNSSRPFNVLVYDYPTPQLNCARDLILYGDTLFQAAVQQLGISVQNLHGLGYSLGGAVGAIVADMHPDAGRFVSLQSFASMENVITDPQGMLGDDVLPYFARWILAKINTAIGWGIEASDALQNLRNKTLFVYSREDEVLPPSVTAVTAVGEGNVRGNRCIAMQLREGATVQHYHGGPLNKFRDAHGNSVASRIMNFLLGRRIFACDGLD